MKRLSVFGTEKKMGACSVQQCKDYRWVTLTINAEDMAFIHERRVCDGPSLANSSFRELRTHEPCSPAGVSYVKLCFKFGRVTHTNVLRKQSWPAHFCRTMSRHPWPIWQQYRRRSSCASLSNIQN
jgi:hypothetical protein